MDNDTYDDRIPRMNDQTNIKFLKQEEFNANVVKRLEELEDKVELIDRYGTKDKSVRDDLTELQYNIDTKLERIDDILVVQRNQTDNQRKNFHELRSVLDDKVMNLLEGKHGESK